MAISYEVNIDLVTNLMKGFESGSRKGEFLFISEEEDIEKGIIPPRLLSRG